MRKALDLSRNKMLITPLLLYFRFASNTIYDLCELPVKAISFSHYVKVLISILCIYYISIVIFCYYRLIYILFMLRNILYLSTNSTHSAK